MAAAGHAGSTDSPGANIAVVNLRPKGLNNQKKTQTDKDTNLGSFWLEACRIAQPVRTQIVSHLTLEAVTKPTGTADQLWVRRINLEFIAQVHYEYVH